MRKEIIKSRIEVNEIDNQKNNRKYQPNEHLFFQKINKTDKLLVRQTKKKERKLK